MQDPDAHSSSITALELISNAIPLLQEQERQRGHAELDHHRHEHIEHEHHDEHARDYKEDGGRTIEEAEGVEDLLNHPQVHDRILHEHTLQHHHQQQLHAQHLEQLRQSGYSVQEVMDLSQSQEEPEQHHHHHHPDGHEEHGEEQEQDARRDERTLAEIALDDTNSFHPHSHQPQGHAQHHSDDQTHMESSLDMLGAESDGYGISLRDPQRLIDLPEGLPLPLPLELDPEAEGISMEAGPSSSSAQGQTPMYTPVGEGLQSLGEFEPMEYETFDELYESVASRAKENGFSVSIYNPTRSKKGVLRAANLRCSKSGKHRETRTNETRRRKAHTSKTDCPFNIYAHRTDPISNKFTFFVKSGEHNHLPDYSKSGKPIRRKIRSGVVGPGGTVNAAGTGGGADLDLDGDGIGRKRPGVKGKGKGGKGKGKSKSLVDDTTLLEGMTETNGMDVDPDDPDGVGLGGMMHGVNDEDGFGVDGGTTLAALGQEMVDGMEDDERNRERHQEEADQAGYHEHGHTQEDHLDHHPHPSYSDHHGTEQDPEQAQYPHDERDHTLDSAFQGADPRSSNVSDLRTRQEDESLVSASAQVDDSGVGNGHGEQLEMSLNGAMAAAESMGIEVGELQGLDVGYMDEGDLEQAGEVGAEGEGEAEGRYDVPLEHELERDLPEVEEVEPVERDHGEEQAEEEVEREARRWEET